MIPITALCEPLSRDLRQYYPNHSKWRDSWKKYSKHWRRSNFPRPISSPDDDCLGVCGRFCKVFVTLILGFLTLPLPIPSAKSMLQPSSASHIPAVPTRQMSHFPLFAVAPGLVVKRFPHIRFNPWNPWSYFASKSRETARTAPARTG